MSSQFLELMARENLIGKEGYVTPQEVSGLSGNSVSYEENLLGKLVEAGRIAKIELHLPRYPSDGLFGDGNKITYFMRSDLFRKIQQEEKNPESLEREIRETYGYSKDTSPVRRYTGFDYARITSLRWKLFVEGKEGFKIPGVIKC